jgi:ADP-glucose pyrophosphorylase
LQGLNEFLICFSMHSVSNALSCLVQDYAALLRTHRENNADITIATHSVGWKQASLRGITRVDENGKHSSSEEPD